jgi:hypothetical protein
MRRVLARSVRRDFSRFTMPALVREDLPRYIAAEREKTMRRVSTAPNSMQPAGKPPGPLVKGELGRSGKPDDRSGSMT